MANPPGNNLGTPSRNARRRFAVALLLAYSALLALLTLLNGLGGDRWWFGAFNHYLPQAIWLIPLLPLAATSAWWAKRWLWLLPVLALWVLGPIMGFQFHLPDRQGAGTPLRILTCNMKYGTRDTNALFRDISAYRPELVCLQDVLPANRPQLASFFKDWQVWSEGQFWIASRHPLERTGPPRKGALLGMEPDYPFSKVRVLIQGTPLAVYSVHLLSPREGLNALRPDQGRLEPISSRIRDLRENVDARLAEARQLAGAVRTEPGHVLVMGDLNALDGSQVCRMMRQTGLRDAFAEAGVGYGYTYGHFLLDRRFPWLPHFSWMRIDHIMISQGVRVRRCMTGTSRASDHRPVIADLCVPDPL